MFPWPLPDPDVATSEATPESVDLDTGEKAVVTYEPEQSSSVYRIPTVAASKRSGSTYTIWMDDNRVWGPAAIPPTDIDDLVPVWTPSKRLTTSMRVEVANVAETGGVRTYHVLPVGWEVSQQ